MTAEVAKALSLALGPSPSGRCLKRLETALQASRSTADGALVFQAVTGGDAAGLRNATNLAREALYTCGRARDASAALRLFQGLVARRAASGQPPPERELYSACLRICARAGTPRFAKAATSLLQAARAAGYAPSDADYECLVAAAGDGRGRGMQPSRLRVAAAQAMAAQAVVDGVPLGGGCLEALLAVCREARDADGVEAALRLRTGEMTAKSYSLAVDALSRAGRHARALQLLHAWRGAAASGDCALPPSSALAKALAGLGRGARGAAAVDLAWDLMSEQQGSGGASRAAYHSLMDVALAARLPDAVFDAQTQMEKQGLQSSGGTWARMVAAASLRSLAEGETLFRAMQASGFAPTPGCFGSLMHACARAGDAAAAGAVAAEASAAGVELEASANAAWLVAAGAGGATEVASLYRRLAPGGDRALVTAAIEGCLLPSGLLPRAEEAEWMEDECEAALGSGGVYAQELVHLCAKAAALAAAGEAAESSFLAAAPSITQAASGAHEAARLLKEAVAMRVLPSPFGDRGETVTLQLRLLTRSEALAAVISCLLELAEEGVELPSSLTLHTSDKAGGEGKREAALARLFRREGLAWTEAGAVPAGRGLRVSGEQLRAWVERVRGDAADVRS